MPRLDRCVKQAEVSAQLVFRLVGRAKLGTVDVTVAVTVRQRNFPRPAVLERGGYGLRRNVAAYWRRQRDGRIVEQIVLETHKRGLHRLLTHQARDAAAID